MNVLALGCLTLLNLFLSPLLQPPFNLRPNFKLKLQQVEELDFLNNLPGPSHGIRSAPVYIPYVWYEVQSTHARGGHHSPSHTPPCQQHLFFPSESCNLVILLPGHERFLKSHLFCMLCFGYNPFEASTTVLHVSVLRVTAGSCSMTWALGFCSTIITQICRVYKHMVTHTQGKP